MKSSSLIRVLGAAGIAGCLWLAGAHAQPPAQDPAAVPAAPASGEFPATTTALPLAPAAQQREPAPGPATAAPAGETAPSRRSPVAVPRAEPAADPSAAIDRTPPLAVRRTSAAAPPEPSKPAVAAAPKPAGPRPTEPTTATSAPATSASKPSPAAQGPNAPAPGLPALAAAVVAAAKPPAAPLAGNANALPPAVEDESAPPSPAGAGPQALDAVDPARVEALPAQSAMTDAIDGPSGRPGEILVEAVGQAPIPVLGALDLEAYADGLVPQAIARGGLAGAVVVVVKDGQVLLSKGYGYADPQRRRPMDPARSVLRTGSLSALLTWTAVMQLVERGKLDLDADIDTYLDFRLRDDYPQPVTLRQLMTHSAGFEPSLRHRFAGDESRLPALGDYLKAAQPRRIYPPGAVPAYSDYGVALAGYIVERVAAQPFDDYIEQQVLEPLRMRHSSFRQPLPKGLRDDMAQGVAVAGGAPIGFELINAAPAAGLSSTGEDMARFMLALLDQGRYEGQALVQPHTLQAMQASAWRPIAGLDAMTLGFVRRDGHGPVMLGLDGATQAFHSRLMLLPMHRLGVFVCADGPGDGGRALQRELIDGIVQRYFPRPFAQTPSLSTAYLHGRQVAGRYESSVGAASNFMLIARLFGATTVALNEDETISVSSLRTRDGRVKRWREIEPYLWREVDADGDGGGSLLAAKLSGGEVVAIGSDDLAQARWLQPVPGWRSPGWMLPLLALSVAVHVLALLAWPLAAWLRRRDPRWPRPEGRERDLRLLTLAGLIANTLLALLWAWIVARALATPAAPEGALDGWIRLAQALGVLSLPIALIACLNARAAWRGPARRQRRIGAVAIALACVAVVWFVFALHTLSISLRY